MTDLLVSPPTLVTFNTTSTQHIGASSQNPLGIHWPPVTMSGTDLPFTEPIHHPGRTLPFVSFFELNTPNINTVNQTLNLTPSSKEAMRQNIEMQMALMQQQLNALNQDDDFESKEAAMTPRGSGRNKEIQKDKEGESSSTNISALEDAQLIRKVEEVIQKAKTGPRKEDECVMEVTLPFVNHIMETKIPTQFKLL